MTIVKWYGHSCFKIEFDNGVSVLTDPFNKKSYDGAIRYKDDFDKTDIITVSHSHKDHSFIPYPESAKLLTAEEKDFRGITVRGFKTFHDKSRGAERGENIIFRISDGKCDFVHMGDIGCIPDEKAMEFIKGCRFLMIPVGGRYTVNAEEAKSIVDAVSPGIVFPMHYKNEYIDFDISPVSDFLNICRDRHVEMIEGATVSVSCREREKIVVFKL